MARAQQILPYEFAEGIGLAGVMLAKDESGSHWAAGFYEKLGFNRSGCIIDGESEFEFVFS